MKPYIALLFLVMSIGTAYTQTMPQFPYEEMDQKATKFFGSYGNLEADMLASLFADDIEYIDETYAGIGGKAAKVSGKENLRNHYKKQAFAHAIKFIWQEETRFFSGEQGIFRGILTAYYKGTMAGRSADITYTWTAPYVVVLTFKDGKIIRQNDYLDYRAAKWVEVKK